MAVGLGDGDVVLERSLEQLEAGFLGELVTFDNGVSEDLLIDAAQLSLSVAVQR
ncbi:MAG: hypothetical protein ACREXW_04585 [Gammaproteobacteria bacterium]